jgi:hypothetical protein
LKHPALLFQVKLVCFATLWQFKTLYMSSE